MFLVAFYWMAVGVLGGGEQLFLVDEVVAVVNREVITRSDVYQEGVLILIERRGVQGLGLKMTPKFLSEVLDMLVNQRLLLNEANRLGMPLEEDQNRSDMFEEFKRRFKDESAYNDFLEQYHLTSKTVLESLTRHRRVERLKQRKLQMMPGVSEEEIRRYYEKNRNELGGVSFELMKQPIRLKLLTRKGREVLSRWIEELRRRSQVKLLVDMEKRSG